MRAAAWWPKRLDYNQLLLVWVKKTITLVFLFSIYYIVLPLLLQVTADYDSIYQHSISKPEVFWADRAKEYLHWEQPFDTVMEGDPLGTRWFRGGKINASGNPEKVVLPFQYFVHPFIVGNLNAWINYKHSFCLQSIALTVMWQRTPQLWQLFGRRMSQDSKKRSLTSMCSCKCRYSQYYGC